MTTIHLDAPGFSTLKPIITCGECGMKLGTPAAGDPTFGKRLFIAHRSLGQCEALR